MRKIVNRSECASADGGDQTVLECALQCKDVILPVFQLLFHFLSQYTLFVVNDVDIRHSNQNNKSKLYSRNNDFFVIIIYGRQQSNTVPRYIKINFSFNL